LGCSSIILGVLYFSDIISSLCKFDDDDDDDNDNNNNNNNNTNNNI